MKQQSFFSQLIARLTSETPVFFKKVFAFGATVLAVGAAILGSDELKVLNVPPMLYTIAQYMVTIGTVIGLVAKTTTVNPDLQAKGGSNTVVNTLEGDGKSTVAAKAPEVTVKK